MRKWMISLLSILALAFMFTGCSDDSGSVSSSVGMVDVVDVVEVEVEIVEVVDAVDAEITTPKTPYNLSMALGTPPGLPAN